MELVKQIDLINLVKKGLNLNPTFLTDKAEIRDSIQNVKTKNLLDLNQQFTIEYHSPGRLPCLLIEKNGYLPYLDEKMFDLIEFVKQGNRLVPPVMIRTTKYIEWIEQPEKNYWLEDGVHRTTLAYILGIKGIPFILMSADKLEFSIFSNDLTIDNEKLVVSGTKGQNAVFSLGDFSICINTENQTVEVDGCKGLQRK